jgi:hypothetical protein
MWAGSVTKSDSVGHGEALTVKERESESRLMGDAVLAQDLGGTRVQVVLFSGQTREDPILG